MDFNLSEEQRILQKSARDFMEDNCTSEFVRAMEEDERGFTDELWQAMAELGWLALMIPEDYDGIGLGMRDLVVLVGEMGRACLPGPYLDTVIGSLAVTFGGSAEMKQEVLPQVAMGETVISLAYLEPSSTRYDPAWVALQAEKTGDAYRLSGTKLFVQDAPSADYQVVSARSSGQAADTSGISLFLVPAGAEGITLTPLPNISGQKLFEVAFDGVEVSAANLLGDEGQAWPILDKVLSHGALAKCAEMMGGAARVCRMTVDYAKERVQFGQPIGSFQAVQHHCANMLMDIEGGRYITYKAAWAIDQGADWAMLLAAAKAWCSEAYRRVVGVGHQIGAATAYMSEHDMTLYSRRAKTAELAFGDAHYHRERAAQAMGL